MITRSTAVAVMVAGLLLTGGGIASAGHPKQSSSLPGLPTLNQALQQAGISQQSNVLLTATNQAVAGGNTCYAGCPSIAVADNLLQSVSLNIGLVTQTLAQVAVNLQDVGSPTINVGAVTINVGPLKIS